MSRLVAALREYASWDQFRGGCQGCAMEEAAEEIERLRKALATIVGMNSAEPGSLASEMAGVAASALAPPLTEEQKEV